LLFFAEKEPASGFEAGRLGLFALYGAADRFSGAEMPRKRPFPSSEFRRGAVFPPRLGVSGAAPARPGLSF
jgi:hypothetical protein